MSALAWPDPSLRARLAEAQLSHLGLLRCLAEVAAGPPAPRRWRLGVSANVNLHPIEAHLQRVACLEGLGLTLSLGRLGAHLENLKAFREAEVDSALLLWNFDALAPAWEARAGRAWREALASFEAELSLVLEASRGLPRVLVPTLHRLGSPVPGDGVQEALTAFQGALEAEARRHPQVRLLDSEALLQALGQERALSWRQHLLHLAPYTGAFWEALGQAMLTELRPGWGEGAKLLVVDADGTLWGGVLGEDGVAGLTLGPEGPGAVHWRVQHMLSGLQARGALLALCSKNDEDLLRQALREHPHMVLREQDFISIRAGWGDKVPQLKALAEELGLGLEAVAFLDDSPVEVEAVRQRLPGVRVVQVPPQVERYPEALAELLRHFPPPAQASDATAAYRRRAEVQALAAAAPTQEAFLASLGSVLRWSLQARHQAARLAELSQKTNQFNLCTPRYTEAQVLGLMEEPGVLVVGLSLQDRFGEGGVVGMVGLRVNGEVAEVFHFCLSCRVLGRGLEWGPWAPLVELLQARGVLRLVASHRPTLRNGQVADFWPQLGLGLVGVEGDGTRRFEAPLAALRPPALPHLQVLEEGPHGLG